MKVSTEHFGAVYSGFPQDVHFLDVMSEMGAQISRWPGGTLSELRPDVYDIADAVIFDPTFLFAENASRVRLSLSEAMTYTSTTQTLNVIVPTYRYADDLNQGASDIDALLANLAQDTALDGKTIRLELGNEYYALTDFDAATYGTIANEFLGHLQSYDTLSLGFDLEVSVQAGKGIADNADILSNIEAEHLSRIDAVNVHTIPINYNNLYAGSGEDDRFIEMAANFEDWSNAFASLGLADPERHATAWGVGQAASAASDVDLNFQDYGARGAVTTIALFAEMLKQNISEASVWGVGVSNLSTFGQVEDGDVVLSHAGTIFKELSNSVVGLSLLEGISDIDWRDSSGAEFGYQAYAAPGRLVLYAVTGDSTGVSSDLNLASLIPGFDVLTAKLTEAKSITTNYAEGYTPDGSNEDRLFEVPEVIDVRSDPGISDISDGWIDFTDQSRFQITEATLSWRHQGSSAGEVIDGLEFADEFAGLAGNDTLRGFGGDDVLLGGSVNDILEGGSGHDLLLGDEDDIPAEYWEWIA